MHTDSVALQTFDRPSDWAIKFDNITFSYAKHPILHHCQGAIREGGLTAIVGPNGAGKTTLLKILAGELKPDEGQVEFKDSLRKPFLMRQTGQYNFSVPVKCLDLVLSGQDDTWFYSKRSKQIAQELLTKVNLSDYSERYLHTLSPGQMKRVLYCRAIMSQRPSILLDEPLADVDQDGQSLLLQCMQQVVEEGNTIVVVVHSLEIVRKYFSNVILLARDVVAWGDVDQVLTPENVNKAYTTNLAWTEDAEPCSI